MKELVNFNAAPIMKRESNKGIKTSKNRKMIRRKIFGMFFV
jgi:hypothetical protein